MATAAPLASASLGAAVVLVLPSLTLGLKEKEMSALVLSVLAVLQEEDWLYSNLQAYLLPVYSEYSH